MIKSIESISQDLKIQIKEEIYKVFSYNASILIPERNFEVSVIQTAARELVATVKINVLKRTSFVKRETGPSSVWQHFKRDWMPKWFTKIYPVEYSYELIELRDIYPQHPLTENDLGRGFVTIVRTELSKPYDDI